MAQVFTFAAANSYLQH